MAEQKPALVLHLAAGGEPLLFALPPEESAKLEEKLVELITTGAVETVRTNDGSVVAINFKHVAAAYIDDLQRKGKVFGLH
jgi:DNA mismatch repair protein MutH